MRRSAVVLICLIAVIASAYAQDQPKPVPSISPIARLRAAKTAYIKNGGGSDFPFNLFQSTMEGWGRIVLVDAPAKADIVVEVAAPLDDSGISVSSSTTANNQLGTQTEGSSKSYKQLYVQRIILTVYDARTNVRLWSAIERPKSAMKQSVREENIAAATQSLFTKFKQVIDPAPAQAPVQ